MGGIFANSSHSILSPAGFLLTFAPVKPSDPTPPGAPTPEPRPITLDGAVTVTQLANLLGVTPSTVVANLLEFGVYAESIDMPVKYEDAVRVAKLNGFVAMRGKHSSKHGKS